LDVPKKEYHTKIKVISAGTIKSECTFLLVGILINAGEYYEIDVNKQNKIVL
jgi:hypothetical protein